MSIELGVSPGERVKIGKIEGEIRSICLGLPDGPRLIITQDDGKIISIPIKRKPVQKKKEKAND